MPAVGPEAKATVATGGGSGSNKKNTSW